MQHDELVLKYIYNKKLETLQDVEKQINDIAAAYQRQEMLCWTATIRAGKTIIGTCGFNRIEKENLRAEIGGTLSPRYWGARVAMEAVGQIVDYGLTSLGLHTIEARVNADNRSAIFLLERLGFVKEAHFRKRMLVHGKQFKDLVVYTKFKD